MKLEGVEKSIIIKFDPNELEKYLKALDRVIMVKKDISDLKDDIITLTQLSSGLNIILNEARDW